MSRKRAADEQRPVTFRHRVEYAAARVAAVVFSVVGVRVTYFLCEIFGRLAYWLDGRHRRITIDNIEQAKLTDVSGNPLTPKQVRRMALRAFIHFVRIAAESVLVDGEIERRGFENVVKVEGIEHVRAAMTEGRGAIFVTGHVGSWEIMGITCDRSDLHGTTVYRPLDNPLLDRWVREVRGHDAHELVAKRGALRRMLAGLRRGRLCAILIDQDARRHGVFVPFFGRPASTYPTPAQLALKTGAEIITGFAVWTGPGLTYRQWFEPPVPVERTGDQEADVLTITAEITRRLETAVRRTPEQWLWLHRRWKTKPPPGAVIGGDVSETAGVSASDSASARDSEGKADA